MKDMKNNYSSTNATIKGSSRANNKRSIAAVSSRFSLGETPKKSKSPAPAHHQEKIEEEEEESKDGVSKGVMSGKGKGKGSITVTLTDPDLLDCPICFMSLTIPLFQCENGHIACASCCTKLMNKCPSCSSPIGFNRCGALEKIVESVKVPCPNNTYGCNHSIIYNELRHHHPACIHTPCSCPNRACKFLGSSNQLYTHFSTTHVKAKHITFNSPTQISLKKNQRFIYLQEKSGGVIFVVNHHLHHRLGSAVNIICIAPGSSKRRFLYKLEAAKGEEEERCVKGKGSSGEKTTTTSIKLEAVAENIPKWDPSASLNIFLLVPDDVISDDQLKLEVCIKDSS